MNSEKAFFKSVDDFSKIVPVKIEKCYGIDYNYRVLVGQFVSLLAD